MLELVATTWAYALVITTSLLVGVLVVQGVVRHARSASRVVQQAVVDGQRTSSTAELASAGSRAA